MRLILTALATALFATHVAANTLPEPPDLAHQGKYQTNEVRVVLDAPLDEAWTFWRSIPITDFLEPTDRIPAIAEMDVIKGPWGAPGSVRRVNFEGGGSALERVLTSTDREFTYQIWNIETASGRFIDHIHGVFQARPTDAGTEISWSYNVKPAAFYARPFIGSFLRNDFAPFMEGGMAGMSQAYAQSQTQ